MNFSAEFSLDSLRKVLIRLEDTILFALIERAQFAWNPPIYRARAGPFEELPFDGCFVQYLLHEMEVVHAKVRRYTSPDEHPFTPLDRLPAPILPSLDYPRNLLHPNQVNLNDQLYRIYVQEIVPKLTKKMVAVEVAMDADTTHAAPSRSASNMTSHTDTPNDKSEDPSQDDQNYGSAATRDVECLQAMSRRIHYGKFIAEAKFTDPR